MVALLFRRGLLNVKQHIRLEMDYEQMNHLYDSFNASNKGIEIDVPNSNVVIHFVKLEEDDE